MNIFFSPDFQKYVLFLVFNDGTPYWIPFDGQNIPKYAVECGKEENRKLYVGRAHRKLYLHKNLFLFA